MYCRHTALIIAVDLSQPNELWFTLESLLAAAKARVETILSEMKNTNPQIRQDLIKEAWQRVGEEHPVSFLVMTILSLTTWTKGLVVF